jgi:transcriptional regulator with XRE-family HTH domain
MAAIDERFANRVRKVRRFRSLTLEQVGESVGLALNVVSKIEKGQRKVSIGEAVAIAGALSVPLQSLVSDNPLVIQLALED